VETYVRDSNARCMCVYYVRTLVDVIYFTWCHIPKT
jgi:hypothetical protein